MVETTNFRDRTIIRKVPGRLSEALHVVERYTRTGPDTLDWEFTVTDPGTWTRSWTGSLPMARTQDPMFEYSCHEGNYGLYNILTGSRARRKPARKPRHRARDKVQGSYLPLGSPGGLSTSTYSPRISRACRAGPSAATRRRVPMAKAAPRPVHSSTIAHSSGQTRAAGLPGR